jgi:hypothetical protein
VLTAPFNETGSRTGSGSDLNGDGVIDWGSTSTASGNTNYLLARTAQVGGIQGGVTIGQAFDANTWEFKLATFNLDVGTQSFHASTTTFNVVQPNAKATVGPLTYASGSVDNTTFNVNSSNTQGAYAGSQGITLYYNIPEPAGAGLMGAAAIGLLGRRRRGNG